MCCSKSVFVVLNYNTLDETRKCIESIRRLNGGSESHIIVIDNHSKENVSSISNAYYNVHLIRNEFNLGFAKGNNIGYQMAKYLYKAEFVIVLNSDTIIEQDDFLQCMREIYNRTSFHILGPDIITKQGMHQNPARNVCTTYKEVNNQIVLQIIRLIKTYISFIDNMGIKGKRIQQEYISQELEGVALHGACLIFSPLYIEKHEHAFYPNTFLYGEEEFLFFNAKINNEKMIYTPNLKITHMEDAATEKITSNELVRKRFVLKNSIMSLFKLKKFLRTIRRFYGDENGIKKSGFDKCIR